MKKLEEEKELRAKYGVEESVDPDDLIRNDILKYFSKIKENTPAFYYFKRRELEIMDYIY